MVDVAAIFDEVFGADERTNGSSENGCVPAYNLLIFNNIPNTPCVRFAHTLI